MIYFVPGTEIYNTVEIQIKPLLSGGGLNREHIILWQNSCPFNLPESPALFDMYFFPQLNVSSIAKLKPAFL